MLLGVVAITTLLFSACDEVITGTTMPGFPTDTLTFTKLPNDTAIVTFQVGTDWKISSNKNWCLIDGLYLDYSGKEGTQSIPFIITDEGQNFIEEQAEITLWTNQQNGVIAIITRMATSYAMTISDGIVEYNESQPLVIGTTGSKSLSIDANFNLDELYLRGPQWLILTRDGKDLTLNVKADSVKYTINHPEDSLVLFKKDGSFRRSIHIQYAGMDDKALLIQPIIEGEFNISRDGKRCKQGNDSYDIPLTFSVSALNDKYEVITVGHNGEGICTYLPKEKRWFIVEDNHMGKVNISFFENLGDDRYAHLFALPKALMDSIANVNDEDQRATLICDFLYENTDDQQTLTEIGKTFLVASLQPDGVMYISIAPEAQWGLKISTDGKTYSNAMSATTGVTYETPIKATVTTHRGYELIHVTYDSKKGCTVIADDESWLNIADNGKGNIEIFFEENTDNERTAYLFALPLALTDSLHANTEIEYEEHVQNCLFEEINGLFEMKDESEKFLIGEFIQEACEDASMKVIDGPKYKQIEVGKETDKEWIDIISKRGVAASKIFKAEMTIGYPYLLNPLLPLAEWNPGIEDGGKIEILGKSGHQYVAGEDYLEEPTMMEEEGDYMLIQLRAYIFDEPFVIYFIDNKGKALKALAVTPI